MKDRIAEFLKKQELTPSKLAELLGVQPSSISHLLSGRNKPGFDFIVKFLQRFPTVDPDWLLLGKGNIFRDTNHHQPTEFTNSVTPDLFTSIDIPSEATSQSSIKKKNDTNDGTPSYSDPEIKTVDTQELPQNVLEKNQQIEQMIICFEDHTFITYIPRK